MSTRRMGLQVDDGTGHYTVGVNPHNFNPNGSSFGDHTTGTGNMFIANGSTSANTVVWQETVNVSSDTDSVLPE